MEKAAAFYEGKATILCATDNPDYIIEYFKDDATAFSWYLKPRCPCE